MKERFRFKIVRKSDGREAGEIIGDYTSKSVIMPTFVDICDRDGTVICTLNTMVYKIERRFIEEDLEQQV